MLPRYKDIVDLIKKGATFEAQEKILELREAALALQEENIELRERNSNLEQQLDRRHSVVWEAPYYWMQVEDKREGPFCQNCWDAGKKLIRLQQPGRVGFWTCLSCGKNVTDKSYREPEAVSIGRSKFDGYI